MPDKLAPRNWPNWLRIVTLVVSGVWIVSIPLLFSARLRMTWMPWVGVVSVILLVALNAVPTDDGATTAEPATATSDSTPASPEATPIRASPEATPTPVAERVAVVVRGIHHLTWDDWLHGIRVHFVAQLENTGNVTAEVRNIRYTMRGADGALLEVGDVPHAFPQKLAPGQFGVIGRTISADTAIDPADVSEVVVTFDVRRADHPDNLVAVVSVRDPEHDLGNIQVTGTVKNTSEKTYDNIKIVVILVNADGEWFGYATAELPTAELPPGELARFVTHADLPVDVLPPIASVEVIAFDK